MSYMLEAQSTFPGHVLKSVVMYFWWTVLHKARVRYIVRHGIIVTTSV